MGNKYAHKKMHVGKLSDETLVLKCGSQPLFDIVLITNLYKTVSMFPGKDTNVH